MFKLSTKDQIFFELFVEMSRNVSTSAVLLKDLMVNYVDVSQKIRAIEKAEHTCDMLVHKIMKFLNESFITPIDREDICAITKQMDNIIDNIESTAHRFEIFKIESIREDAINLSDFIIKCTQELELAMAELKNMKKSKTLKNKLIEINRLEGEGDVVFRKAMTSLFESQIPSIEVIKWKEIFEYLENTLDSCEDVTDVLEGVITKHT